MHFLSLRNSFQLVLRMGYWLEIKKEMTSWIVTSKIFKKIWEGELVFLRDEPPYWIDNTKQSALKPHTYKQ